MPPLKGFVGTVILDGPRTTEDGGPYNVAATFCKLLCGDVSDEIIGFGFSFGIPQPVDMNHPVVQEDINLVPVQLDKEMCDFILKKVKEA